jgi:hypothetical protein
MAVAPRSVITAVNPAVQKLGSIASSLPCIDWDALTALEEAEKRRTIFGAVEETLRRISGANGAPEDPDILECPPTPRTRGRWHR